MAERMSEEEMNGLIEKINGYWSNRPKGSGGGEKEELVPLHDFDKLEFTSEEHVRAVRDLYENMPVEDDHLED